METILLPNTHFYSIILHQFLNKFGGIVNFPISKQTTKRLRWMKKKKNEEKKGKKQDIRLWLVWFANFILHKCSVRISLTTHQEKYIVGCTFCLFSLVSRVYLSLCSCCKSSFGGWWLFLTVYSLNINFSWHLCICLWYK